MDLVYTKRERIVGAFLFLIILLGLATVVVIGRGKDWFRSYAHYYTEFDESYNLSENAQVKMAKTKIGKVKSITLSGNRVRVDLAILEEYVSRIRLGSVATVESPTLIGDEYVSIKPGPTTAAQVPPGGEIHSQPKPSITDLLAEFQVEETGKKVVVAIQETTDIIHRLQDPEGPLFSALERLNQNLAHTENILAGIERGEGTLGSLLRRQELARELEKNLILVNGILEQIHAGTKKAPETVDRILKNVADTTDRVPETVDEFRASLESLNEMSQKLSVIMDQVQKILENVQEASYDVPQVAESAKHGINELRDSMQNVDDVVRSIKKNPLIRGNLPPEPEGQSADANLRP